MPASPPELLATPSGVDLAVYRHGDRTKPTVVLVHGFPDDHRVWENLTAKLTAEHCVVTYDVRGSGASSKPRRIADYRLDLLTEDLQTVIDHVDGGDGVHLVGHDWGSVQGWHLITDPDHHAVASYTSISGPCLDHLAGWVGRKARAGRWLDFLALWKSPLYMGLLQLPILAPWLCRLGLVDLSIAATVKAFERPERQAQRPAGPNARANGAAVRMYTANLLPRLLRGDHHGTEVPVQILTPTSDVFIPPLSQHDPHPGVTTTHIEAVLGGHWAPAYNPSAIAQLIATWVATQHRGPTTTRSAT